MAFQTLADVGKTDVGALHPTGGTITNQLVLSK